VNFERDIEDKAGVQLLGQIESTLRQVLSTGTLRPSAVPHFDTTPFFNVAFIYGVTGNGDLVWFKQLPSSQPNAPAGWAGPLTVDHNWGDLRAILPAGGNHYYTVTSDGNLLWYQHDGFNDGTALWQGPIQVGTTWNQFVNIIGGSDGVLYAVQPDGTALWYRHDGFTFGGGLTRGEGPPSSAQVGMRTLRSSHRVMGSSTLLMPRGGCCGEATRASSTAATIGRCRTRSAMAGRISRACSVQAMGSFTGSDPTGRWFGSVTNNGRPALLSSRADLAE
jgi:hypothetical protein